VASAMTPAAAEQGISCVELFLCLVACPSGLLANSSKSDHSEPVSDASNAGLLIRCVVATLCIP
jgi:hypothetical protein